MLLKKYQTGGKALAKAKAHIKEKQKKVWKKKSRTEDMGGGWSSRMATGQNPYTKTRSDTLTVTNPGGWKVRGVRHATPTDTTYENKYKGRILTPWYDIPGKGKKKPKTLPSAKVFDEIYATGKSKKVQKKQTGGKVLKKQSGRRKREWGIEPGTSKLHTLEKGREFRKGLEGAPDLEDDLWAKYQKKGYLVLPQLAEEQSARDAKDKAQKMEKIGLKMPKAAGGSLPLGEGGKKKKKTTDMPHGMYSVTKGVKGKMPQHKLMKKAKLLKK